MMELKFETAFPKANEDYQSTYSKRKFNLLESVLKSLTGIKREDLEIFCFVQIIDVM